MAVSTCAADMPSERIVSGMGGPGMRRMKSSSGTSHPTASSPTRKPWRMPGKESISVPSTSKSKVAFTHTHCSKFVGWLP